MKKIINFFTKHTWLLIIIACLLFIPQSFSYQAKLNMRVIVTGLAIDKNEQGYEVTAQVIMPSPGSEAGGSGAQLDFISEQGCSVSEGVNKIAYKIGKEAGLSHTDFILLGETMLEENIIPALDYFIRDDRVSPSLLLLCCEGNAKEMIKETKNLQLSAGVELQKVFINKESSLNGVATNTAEFVSSSFSPSKTTIVSAVLIAPEGEEELTSGGACNPGSSSSSKEANPSKSAGGAPNLSSKSGNSDQTSSSSGQEKEAQQSSNSNLPGGSQNGSSSSSGSGEQSSSGGDSSGGQGQGQSARIKFYNDIYYFKNGKYVGKLDMEEEVLGYFFTLQSSKNGRFKLDQVYGDILEDATIGVKFTDKKVRKSISFENDKPTLNINIEFGTIQVDEILNRALPTELIYDKQNEHLTQVIREEIVKRINDSVDAAFNKSQKDDVDIFGIANLAYQTKTKQWKAYFDKQGDNYLSDCQIKINVTIKNYI